jgi:hypothetical protein
MRLQGLLDLLGCSETISDGSIVCTIHVQGLDNGGKII